MTPLPWLSAAASRPALLLVTPGRAGLDARRCSRRTRRASGDAGGAARLASEHLADGAPGAGSRAHDLLARAAVLAAANDLAPAAAAVVPALVPFRRALRRLLGRPVGLSGLRPDPLGPLSFARGGGVGRRGRSARRSRRARSRARRRPTPFVAATTIRRARPTRRGRERTMTRQAISTTGAPAAVGPYSQAIAVGASCSAPGRSASTRRPATSSTAASRPRPSAS